MKNEYSRIIGAVPSEPIPERALFEAGLAYVQPPSDKELKELIRDFERVVLGETYNEAIAELRRAELQGDLEAVKALTIKCNEIKNQISALS